MSEHVLAAAVGMPPGPCEITGVLSLADGVPFYQADSVTETRAPTPAALPPAGDDGFGLQSLS